MRQHASIIDGIIQNPNNDPEIQVHSKVDVLPVAIQNILHPAASQIEPTQQASLLVLREKRTPDKKKHSFEDRLPWYNIGEFVAYSTRRYPTTAVQYSEDSQEYMVRGWRCCKPQTIVHCLTLAQGLVAVAAVVTT